VAQQLTSPARLTATGRSAGGILVGGALTRRPELFTAGVLQVPMANILRFERTEGSLANIPELGSLADPDDFRAILASDPYHRLADGARLPALLVTGGVHDVRVPIWQQAKFVARAQAATSSGRPILFRVEREGGHFGSGVAAEEAEWADVYAFALWQSGVPVGK
jgi:prolyl oligopeptidase